MKKKLFNAISKILITILISIFIPKSVNAFLPPEFFVQGLSSIWTILAGGIAMAIVPFLLFFDFIKQLFKEKKKLFIFLLVQNILLAVGLGIFFYYKFYKPLYNDSYLFLKGHAQSSQIDLKELNSDYYLENGYLRDKDLNSLSSADSKFGIKPEELSSKIGKKENVYFVDVREIEEYQVGHIEGAKHLREMDITLEKIKKLFNFNEEQFKNGIFVLICHGGGRGSAKALELNQPNIKYLISGMESFKNSTFENIKLTGSSVADQIIFEKKYQTKYQLLAKDALEMIKKNSNMLVIDGRSPGYYKNKHIKESINFKIGLMTSEEYETKIKQISAKKDSVFIGLADRYSELFYLNLLYLRLQRDYGFSDENFHIVFNQFDEFEKDSSLEFEGE